MELNCQQLISGDSKCYSPLQYCCTVLLLLLNVLHIQDGATPLSIACLEGHHPVVECLIAAMADVNIPLEVGLLFVYHLIYLLHNADTVDPHLSGHQLSVILGYPALIAAHSI